VANQNFKVKKGLEVGTALTATSDGLNVTGVVTATQFSGDGSGLTGVTAAGSGVVVQEEGSNVGTAATINFIGSNVTATISGGVASVTVAGGGDVVTDTTPQLGGNLDLNSKDITGTGNISITGGFNATGVSTFQESVTFQSHASFGDDDKANFGAGNDLQIYHESSSNNSFIKESGSGSFFIQGSDLYLTDEDGTNMLYAANNAGVSLYYGGGKEFETTGYGATVFGTLQSQQLNVSGIATAGGGVRVPANSNIRATTDDSIVIVGDEGLRNGIQISGTTGIGVTEAYIDASGRFVSHADTGEFYLTGSSDTGGTNYFNATSTGTYVGGSQLDPGASNIFLGLGTTSHFLGNVGIGETQPTAKLDVNGNANISGTVSFGSTVTFGNDDRIRLGDNNEFDIYYSGGRSYIKSGVGQLRVKSASSMLFMYENQDGTQTESYATFSHNGAVSLFYDGDKKLETTNHGAIITGVTTATSFSGSGSSLTGLTGASAGTYGASNNTPIITVDANGRITGISTVATAGAGGGGGISNIVEDTTPQLGGNLDLNSKDITGSGDIDYTGNLKVTGISTITGVAGFSSHVTLPDHAEIQVGNATGGDLKIYHDGTNSYVSDVGTGGLKITGGDVYIRNVSDQDMIHASSGSFVKLYHNNALRLQTTGTGVNITDDLNVAGIATANSFVKSSGTSSEFLKADGSTDNSTYLTSETDPVVAAINGLVKSNGTTISAATAGTDYLTPTGDGSGLTGIAVTAVSNTQVTYNFGASGNNYVITGPGYSNSDNNPDLYLVRGQRYRFINATGSSHPLRIQSDTSGTAYTDGVSGSQSGTQEFNVQHDAPSRLFYQCTIHSGMIGNIYITGGANWQMADVAASASAEIYTLNSVGIGTANPRYPLELNSGNLLVSGSSAGNLILEDRGVGDSSRPFALLASNDGNFTITSANRNVSGTTTSSAERLRIKSNGEVRQQSTGGSTIYELKRTDTNTTGAVGTINFTASDGHSVASMSAMGDGDNEGAHIVFRTTSAAADNSPYNAATVERLRITSAGLVGVGTAAGSSSSTRFVVYEESGNAQTIEVKAANTGGVGSQPGIRFTAPNNDNIGAIYADVSSDSLNFSTGNFVQRLRITSAGLVGIGTDNPSGKLNIVGSDTQLLNLVQDSGDLAIRLNDRGEGSAYIKVPDNTSGSLTFETGGSERLRIESDGQVVINRSSGAVLANTSSKLEVYNSTENLIFVSNSTAATGQDAGIMFGPANNVYGGKIIVTSDEDFSTSANRTAHMAFYTRNDGTASERLRIASDGDVRIGDYNTVNRNAGLSINKSDSRLLEMRIGNGTETNFVKRYGFAFVRSTSEATYNLVSLGSVGGNSHVAIQIRMYAIAAVTDQAAIITAYARARQVNNGSYTYTTQTPTIEKFVAGTGIGVGSLSWSNGVLRYSTDANNNYTKYNTEITVWAHDRADVGFY
jgi:hypothetical protein